MVIDDDVVGGINSDGDDDDEDYFQCDTDVLAIAWLTTPCLSAYCLANGGRL